MRAFGDCGAARALAMHCDTFQLADEAFGAAEAELGIASERAGLAAGRFRAPATGETVVI